LLYFSGWHRLQRLENGIMVWEKGDIPPLPEVLPRKDIPTYQKIMWGTVPNGVLASAHVPDVCFSLKDTSTQSP
jgi:hypothetical protein